MRALLRCLTLLVMIFAWPCPASAIAEATNVILQVNFFPGGGAELADPEVLKRLPKPWELRIDRQGEAVQDTFLPITDKRVRKTQKLSHSALEEIIKSVKDTEFFSLPASITSGVVEHRGGITIRVSIDGRSHEVTFLVPALEMDKPAFRRFWRLWRVILAKVPTPNHDEEFVEYLRREYPELL